MTVTYMVATSGRVGLDAALNSIVTQAMPGDQVLVIGATPDIAKAAGHYGCSYVFCPPGHDWGASERNMAVPYATGDYLAFMDDDDEAVMGSRVAMETAFTQHPGQPFIFKMHYPGPGHTLWSAKALVQGNVGTPMFVLPNQPEKLGTWGSEYGGDFTFISSCQWDTFDYVWVDSVIARIRPND